MTASRTRSERNRHRQTGWRRTVPVAAGGLLCVVAVGAAFAWVFGGPWTGSPHVAVATDSSASLATSAGADGTATPVAAFVASAGVDVEVPAVVGKSVRIAGALITAAGLTVQTRVADPAAFADRPEAVLTQAPVPGARVGAGSVVVLTYQPQLGLSASGHRYVVVIDAGHQATPDLTLEPDGPGSTALKPKVSASAIGVSTGQREDVLSLAIALRVRDALSAAGVKVVMVRTRADTNLSNADRAKVGNAAGADLVLRIHQSAASDGSLRGATAFYPSGNDWVRPIEPASRLAAAAVEDAVVAATGARKGGVVGRSDLAGFNYSTVPSVMLECGYLSNREEDAVLVTEGYRARVGTGIVTGVLDYLRSL